MLTVKRQVVTAAELILFDRAEDFCVKAGTIANLRVVSGPALLQKAALDAVSTWRYRPYLLNGQPVKVETTINVTFSLQ